MVKWNTENNGYGTSHVTKINGKMVRIEKVSNTSGYSVYAASKRVNTLANLKLAKDWATNNVK